MNRDSTSLQDPSSRFTARDFFYSNLRIQEVVTTIRYGIEARKGLIVLLGDAGSGKTTLLQKVTTAVAANVTCIFESDPRASFAEVLRLMLRELGCEVSDQDEPAMVRACRSELRSRSERCEIVSLLLDNAHHLPDQTLRHIMQNFLGGSAEDLDSAPLQLVLAGRSELRAKLSQAALIPLRRRRPILCELKALSNQEIGRYIEHGLKSNNHPPALFDDRAIKRVALYAHGNPRAINSLGDRALQLAGATGVVTPELIEGAARDLGLHPSETPSESSPRREFDNPRGDDPPRAFEFGPIDSRNASNPTFPPPFEEEPNIWIAPRNRFSAWVAPLAIVLAFGGAAAMIPTDSAINLLANWSARFNQIAAPMFSQPFDRLEAQPAPPTEKVARAASPIRVPGPDYPTVRQDSNAGSVPNPPAFSETNADERGAASDENPAPRKPLISKPAKINPERRIPLKQESDPPRQNLQTQIAKAIESRAIMGVEVSVVQGTAYLDGHVATERQRSAAERAARSVAGVERVQNRITLG
jgi:general secretion pathway protein A